LVRAGPATHHRSFHRIAKALLAFEWYCCVVFNVAKNRPRRAGVYLAKILVGVKRADLPVEQASKFSFALNVKIAKALGVAVPPMLLARADEVIE
jgi:ABC-type uncharacterized transport system substrate-binding protein